MEQLTHWKTEESALALEKTREEFTSQFEVGGKRYTVLRPHAKISVRDERAFAVYAMYNAKRRLFEQAREEELAKGDAGGQVLLNNIEAEYEELTLNVHNAFRKGFNGDVECVLHLGTSAIEEEMLEIELYPIKANGSIYSVVEIGFKGEEVEAKSIPCILLEVTDIEG